MDGLHFQTYTNSGSREINEDRYGVAIHENGMCFVVADGLGGHGNGEVAAQLAIDAVCVEFVENGYSEEFFENAFKKAQFEILQEQQRQLAPSKMKTTVVNLVISDNKAYWAHVGDSRLYVFQNHRLKLRTLDHSVPQMLVLSKSIKEKEIRNHPDRNRLMRVMGVKGEEPRFDVGDPFKLTKNQVFLLCTDGFWELIEETEMERLLKESQTPKEWIDKMSGIVRKNGEGKEMDNYTAIAVFWNKNKSGWFW